MKSSFKSSNLIAKLLFIVWLLTSATSCGLFHKSPNKHIHKVEDKHEQEGEAALHGEERNPDDLWSQTQYPSSDNMYRLMGQISAIVDTADHGMPSNADMFISNFSEAYHPMQADSVTLARLRSVKKGWQVYISADASGQESRIFVPRLTRLLDQMRYDSSSLYYRGLGLSGTWLHQHFPAVITAGKQIPYACILRQGKLLGILKWEDRNQLAVKLLEILEAERH